MSKSLAQLREQSRRYRAKNPTRVQATKARSYQKHRATVQASCYAYTKTLKGYLVRTYRNMTNRVQGKTKPHLYRGLPLMERSAFYQWALASAAYLGLHAQWQEAGHHMRLAPSIDRINPELGYVAGNVRWITHGENSRRTRRHA